VHSRSHSKKNFCLTAFYKKFMGTYIMTVTSSGRPYKHIGKYYIIFVIAATEYASTIIYISRYICVYVCVCVYNRYLPKIFKLISKYAAIGGVYLRNHCQHGDGTPMINVTNTNVLNCIDLCCTNVQMYLKIYIPIYFYKLYYG